MKSGTRKKYKVAAILMIIFLSSLRITLWEQHID